MLLKVGVMFIMVGTRAAGSDMLSRMYDGIGMTMT